MNHRKSASTSRWVEADDEGLFIRGLYAGGLGAEEHGMVKLNEAEA